MKYIITENKMNDIIKLYLDKLDTWEWDEGDSDFSITDGFNGETIFYYVLGDDEEGVLHIKPRIITELRDIFGNSVGFEQLMELIGEWFNEKYKTNVLYYEVSMD